MSHEFGDCQLNVYNIQAMLKRERGNYQALRFDPNNTCNLQCVYCHNHRSDEVISLEDFKRFVNDNVGSVQFLQFGCIMEPTLDKRLADFVEAACHSPARAAGDSMLQTNGILLHRHQLERMRDAGLTKLSVSLDAADPTVQKDLRNGTSLAKVIRNIEDFRRRCPSIAVEFITTVTSANIWNLAPLVDMGLDIGVSQFIFRELFYYPDNDVVDHSRMPALLLKAGQFAQMRAELQQTFAGRAAMLFAENDVLDRGARDMIANSDFAPDRVVTELQRHG